MAVTEEINEPIDVLTSFHNGAIRPLKFKWAGRTYAVARITYRWITREGSHQIRHFSVVADTEEAYEIALNTHNLNWTLLKVHLEG